MQQFSMGSALMSGGGGTPYDGLYGEAPPERGPFFRPQVYERKGFHSYLQDNTFTAVKRDAKF